MQGFFDTAIDLLKGVGPQRAIILNKYLKIFTFGDLIQHYPFRYEDRTKFYTVGAVNDQMPYVQIKGKIVNKEIVGTGQKKRLVGHFKDETGPLELVWFKGINWVTSKIKEGIPIIVFGKPTRFGKTVRMAHPELELCTENTKNVGFLQPVYPLSAKLRVNYLDSKFISKLQLELLNLAKDKIRGTLPNNILNRYKLISKRDS